MKKSHVVRGVAAIGISAVLTFGPIITSYASGEQYVIHTVESGDSLWEISVRYEADIQQIIQANGITDINNIMVGQQLKIPVISSLPENTTLYIVKSGDTLWKIANNHGVSLQDMLDINHIDPDAQLLIGQELYIPLAAQDAAQRYHIVQSGDSLWKIGWLYDVPIQTIMDANHLTESTIIYVGQKLIIPEGPQEQPQPTQPYVTYKEHVVQSGDNAWSISIQYGIPMTELMQVNKLTNQSVLQVGQVLTIPVHHVPVMSTPGPQYGEYLDWWTQAQYVFPIGAKAKIIDFDTGKSFNVIRSYGAFHADCEPLTAQDAAMMYEIWGNQWSWTARAAIVEYNGRKIAASVSNMPHDIQNIRNNDFNGHFDIHFLNSTRHKDNQVSEHHQEQIKIAAGVK